MGAGRRCLFASPRQRGRSGPRRVKFFEKRGAIPIKRMLFGPIFNSRSAPKRWKRRSAATGGADKDGTAAGGIPPDRRSQPRGRETAAGTGEYAARGYRALDAASL